MLFKTNFTSIFKKNVGYYAFAEVLPEKTLNFCKKNRNLPKM